MMGKRKYLRFERVGTSPWVTSVRSYFYSQSKRKPQMSETSVAAFLASFTGDVFTQALETGEMSHSTYKNGRWQQPVSSLQGIGTEAKPSNNCHTFYDCQWLVECPPPYTHRGVQIIGTTGQDFCNPPDWYTLECGYEKTYELRNSYQYEACDDPGDDPGDDCRGCGDDGGSGGGGGAVMIPSMPQTMPLQTGIGACVPACLAQVKMAMCNTGGQPLSQIEGAMYQYGSQMYGMNFPNTGVPLSGMGSFVNHFFYPTILYPVGNYQGAIDAGCPIMIDKFSHMEGNDEIWHSVVVTGYNSNLIYYLDPATGKLETGDAATMFANSHYTIPITGCK